eukprot:scaffold1982_cov93-Amphora_coffeaeformis.AAC.44
MERTIEILPLSDTFAIFLDTDLSPKLALAQYWKGLYFGVSAKFCNDTAKNSFKLQLANKCLRLFVTVARTGPQLRYIYEHYLASIADIDMFMTALVKIIAFSMISKPTRPEKPFPTSIRNRLPWWPESSSNVNTDTASLVQSSSNQEFFFNVSVLSSSSLCSRTSWTCPSLQKN